MIMLSNPYVDIITEYGLAIFRGIGITLLLSLVGTVIGLLLALLLGMIRVQKVSVYDSNLTKFFKRLGITLVKTYVTIIRGTPMIVQAAIFYFGFYELGIKWSALTAGLFTVSINTTAYLTEVIRGAIESVDPGQLEAARSIGMSEKRAMFTIVYPQAIKNAMASIGNEFIINIKDTAVLSTISVVDLFAATKKAGSATFHTFEALMIAAVIYLILTYATSKVLMTIEKRMGVKPQEITSSN